MAASIEEPRGIILLSVAYLVITTIVILSLSTTETTLLLILYPVYLMFRHLNIFKFTSIFSQHDQEFTAQPDLIYRSKLSGQKIRLLRLLPGPSYAKIRCRLVVASLDDVPSYEAISYVWGPPQKRERIECDGQVAYITVSLAQALRRLRSRNTPRTLWADGICINQNNVSEKGHQVERMGEIFKSASRVVVWLGPDVGGEVAQAMAVIEFVHFKIPNPGHGANSIQRRGDPTIENLGRLVESEKGIKDAWKVLGTLFERQWWQRIWCVQEAILAKSIIIMCGANEIDGHLIGVFTRWYHGQGWAGQQAPKDINDAGIKSAYRRLNDWAWTGTALEILDTFRGLQATDPKDKIYALLGLFQLERKENIYNLNLSVDYHKSVPEVLFDSIMCSVREEGSLHFLSYIDHRPDLEDRGDYPSWMPRWDNAREPWQNHLWCHNSSISAGIRNRPMSCDWTYSEKLILKGVELDSISKTTDVFWTTDDSIGGPLREWIESYLLRIEKPTSGDIQAYQRSIIKLAITLSGGFLKKDGWAENRIYFERLAEDVGDQYLAGFYVFMEKYFPQFNVQKMHGMGSFEGRLYQYHSLVRSFCRGRRMFETVNGYIGLGPRSMRKHDSVAVLEGGKIPFILRPRDDGDFSFVGECFVFDVMDTHRLDALGGYGFEEREIVLR
ncbi:uncharacterized protein K460DRAFT_419605 [Cucurbitaria berberidis CBS 394.84]|uniref:Heterokaryon incompatibility domain-containing protein n=1 Tax=Cucurbitaria berberidis CBS 394.84 TaxID=1168544 RepID=A0A9P4G9Q2_9PLEO|nr:uncharacterized protein K460DRAFT_419605 [Cucurbitaria berberidis CBS 394.84]KAF1841559.1 hypothetical protein K460DRAFT_419605 [Cucurbitaria berberidis CBS 394.84]